MTVGIEAGCRTHRWTYKQTIGQTDKWKDRYAVWNMKAFRVLGYNLIFLNFFSFRKWKSKSQALHTFVVLKEVMFARWFIDPASAIEEVPTNHNSKPKKDKYHFSFATLTVITRVSNKTQILWNIHYLEFQSDPYKTILCVASITIWNYFVTLS